MCTRRQDVDEYHQKDHKEEKLRDHKQHPKIAAWKYVADRQCHSDHRAEVQRLQ
jgi:hypothetical protein